jgi:hypothetical protein
MLDLRGSRVGNNGQCPLIANGEIFIHIPSTGIIYKCTGSKQADSVTFVRIDSTEHDGYNINSFSFVHHNSFYNIGGYGYWHWNGQLRKFNTKLGEWDIDPLDREIPLSNLEPGTHFWKSPTSNFVFTFSYIDGNEAVRTERPTKIITIDSVIKLDLSTNNWTVLGKLNPKLKEGLTGFSFRASLDSGILVENMGVLQYFNLLNNTISVSDDKELFQLSSQRVNSILTWVKGDKLFYSNSRTGYIDSVSISTITFTKINDKIYENESNSLVQLGYLGGIVILAGIGWGFRKKLFKVKPVQSKNEVSNKSLISPYTSKEVFTEVEKALLKLLFDNMTVKGSSTSTDEINWILGVGNKSVDMQKRKRSDVIRAINEKYQLLNPGTEINLIDRAKSGVDARLYEYTLNTDVDFLQLHGI